MKLSMIMGIIVIATSAMGETIRLPARYIETTYTIHVLTGITSDEETKAKLVRCYLDIIKHTEDGVSVIRFTSKAGEGKDRSDESQGSIIFEKKDEVVSILRSLPARISRHRMKPVDNSDKIFEGDGIRMTFVTEVKSLRAYLDFVVGDYTFVLSNPADIDKMMRIIENLK